MTQQQYGTWIAGYQWQFYGCGTFKYRATRASAERQTLAYFRRLSKLVRAPLSFIAVAEGRTSGLGHPGMPTHYHFVMAGPMQHKESLGASAKAFWRARIGDIKLASYDREQPGAHYMAKLAGSVGLEFFAELARMNYQAPTDIYAHAQSDPYVPDHVRHLTVANTLVIR